MSQIRRLTAHPLPRGLVPLSAQVTGTFRDCHYWPGLLPRGARVFRYGASIPQLTQSRQQWVNFTEDRFQFAEDAIRFCSLLDMTVSDHGERSATSGRPLPGVAAVQTWNTAAFRGELVVLEDVYVWVGFAAPMAFDRIRGAQITGAPGERLHSTTPGGASQVLLRTDDLGKLRLSGTPVPLPRARLYH